jgi:hypothetical protein
MFARATDTAWISGASFAALLEDLLAMFGIVLLMARALFIGMVYIV